MFILNLGFYYTLVNYYIILLQIVENRNIYLIKIERVIERKCCKVKSSALLREK